MFLQCQPLFLPSIATARRAGYCLSLASKVYRPQAQLCFASNAIPFSTLLSVSLQAQRSNEVRITSTLACYVLTGIAGTVLLI